MNPILRKRRDTDKGVTLVEVLVSVGLLALVGTIVVGIVISAMRLTRSTSSGVAGEGELNDAVLRVVRDVAAADPILHTSTADGWASNSPSATDLTTQAVWDGTCVRTRYYLDTAAGITKLKSSTQVYSTGTCPDPRTPDTTTPVSTKTIIKDYKSTTAAGSPFNMFTYYTKANASLSAPVVRDAVNTIARVEIKVAANVRERAQGISLATSVAPRSLDGALVTGLPQPVCNSFGDVNGADLTVTSDGNYVPTPRITWGATDYGDQFTLVRTYNGVPTQIYTGPTNPHSIDDTGMRGVHGTTVPSYTLTIVGPGGSQTCGPVAYSMAGQDPAAPVVTAAVLPDTSSIITPGFATSANLAWNTVPQADSYVVCRRPLNPDVAPFVPSGSTTLPQGSCDPGWEQMADHTAAAITYSRAGDWDKAFEYAVYAVDTDFIPATRSAGSNGSKMLQHVAAPTVTGATAITYGSNQITWTASPSSTIDGYRVWRRAEGTTPWSPRGANLTAGTTTFTDTGVALDTRMEYMVTAYNQGPRGSAYVSGNGDIYFGSASNVMTVLQYPANPNTWATGTEVSNSYNPDGRNTVSWSATPTSTSYELMGFNTPTNLTDANRAFISNQGAALSVYDSGSGWYQGRATTTWRLPATPPDARRTRSPPPPAPSRSPTSAPRFRAPPGASRPTSTARRPSATRSASTTTRTPT